MPRLSDDGGAKSVWSKRFRASGAEKEERLAGLRIPIIPAEVFFSALMIIAVIFASGGLYRRLAVEWGHRTVAMTVEYKDLMSMSRQEGMDTASIFGELARSGIIGITVQEFTGKDLSNGAMNISYGALGSMPQGVRAPAKENSENAAILTASSDPLLPIIMQYLRIRMPAAKYVSAKQTLIVLPFTVEELGDVGILPNFEGLGFAETVGAVSIFRPAATAGIDGEKVAASLTWVKGLFPSFRCVLQSGLIVMGYPQIQPIAEALKADGISVAQAEFVKQAGAANLFSAMKPDIFPLHSIVRDEVISRALSREQIIDRMVRAVHERSVRIILMRPYELYSSGRFALLAEDLSTLGKKLSDRGYSLGWPDKLPPIYRSFASALALSIVLVVCAWFYARRYWALTTKNMSLMETAALLLVIAVLGVLLLKVGFIARMAGGLCAALVATEAALWALNRSERPFAGFFTGLLIVFEGGIAIAVFYGTTDAMLRLAPFSGVKLTLLLPLLLVFASDLRRRIHPESFTRIMRRPSLWGELCLVGCFAAAALILTVRSDNVSSVPGWEMSFRDLLERALWIRPRTKEFLVGYPCLVLYHSFVHRGWMPRYREILRIGACIAFTSAVNTFCHFHTLLPISALRVVNGWILGLVVGFILLVLIILFVRVMLRRGKMPNEQSAEG
ncbi:hypothetical protein FACS1894167_00290 [Synergistales bacterium]|nr:hypothetical protein FACS1894167_00290 [Synergistales bacterium]